MLREIAAWKSYEKLHDNSCQAAAANLDRAPSQQIGDFIYINDDFKVQEGARLTCNLYIGKPLGFGLQVITLISTCYGVIGTTPAQQCTMVHTAVAAGRRVPVARC